MSQLCAQSILALCTNTLHPMITPFVKDKCVVNGKSYGLSAASYDVRIAHDLTLGPNPVYLLSDLLRANRNYHVQTVMDLWKTKLPNFPSPHALAHTVEDFNIPPDVVGYVCDKSTYARVFVSAFNTLFDPGFKGNATLELVNLGSDIIHIKAGDPICQFTFHWLDEATDRPYAGKYQHQTKAAHGPRDEVPSQHKNT